MTAKQKPKPSEAAVLSPSQPTPPHVEAAVARYREHAVTAPPGIAIRKTKSGAVEIDTDSDVKNGMIALMDAVGTRDMAFFTGYLTQIINANQTGDGTDATAINSALGFIRGVKPRDEVEAALAAQMAATHSATMTFARRLNNVTNIPQQDSAINAYNKLTRSYCAQMDALKRYRSTGEQKVTVTHVTVSDGSQAIIGNVMTGGGGISKKEDTTP